MPKQQTGGNTPCPDSLHRIRDSGSAHELSDSGDIGNLLSGLNSRHPDKAWEWFLQAFSPLLMKAARFHAQSNDLSQDCFLFICEKLLERRFRRLRHFDMARGIPFRAWLTVTAVNLARDWHRQEFGRRRLPRAIQCMDEFDQAVYRLKYMKQLEVPACLALLRERFAEATHKRLSESLARLHHALTPESRWRLSFVNQPLQHRHVSYESGFVTLPFSGEDIPHREAVTSQRLRNLERALSELQARERLLVRLRFEHQLTLEQAAQIAGCTNLHQARRLEKKALEKLRSLLTEENY